MSLFDEKPDIRSSWDHRFGGFYSSKEMDPWLEKVHIELDKLEAVKTWLKDAPEPLFLAPGRSPYISEIEMEAWMKKCPLRTLEAFDP